MSSERYSRERFKRASEDVEESKKRLSKEEQAQAAKGGKARPYLRLQLYDKDTFGIRSTSQEGADYNRDLERKDRLFDTAHDEATQINEIHDRLKRKASGVSKNASQAEEELERFKRKHMEKGEE